MCHKHGLTLERYLREQIRLSHFAGTHESALTANGKNLSTHATHRPICPKELGVARKFCQNPFSDFLYVT